MTKVLTEVSTESNFVSEGLNFRYFLPNVNHRGWGFVYASFVVGEKKIRATTRVKVKSEYWSDGFIIYPTKGGMLSEKLLHRNASERLNEIRQKVDMVFYNYLCNVSDNDTLSLINDIKKTINPNMAKKASKPQSVISMLRQTIDATIPNPKTQKTQKTIVAKFEEFLNTKGLEDSAYTINQRNLEAFRDWLISRLSSLTAKNTLTIFITLAKKVEKRYDLDFHIDRDKITKISDNRTSEEKNENFVALTKDDLDNLSNLANLKENECIVRDLFLLQCYTSIRFEDLKELLNPNNHKVINGIQYAIFKSEKTKTTYHTPLNDNRLYPQTIEIVERYANLEKIPTNYNVILKRLAKMANLNKVFTYTIEKDGKKCVENKRVYEKISSHWGRHTAITNLVRYFGLTAKDIKYISGHRDERLINEVYTNTTTTDNVNIISDALGRSSKNDTKPNYNIYGIDEAKSVMRFLSLEFDDDISFDDALNKIGSKQWELIDNYGVSVEVMKAIFNISLPMAKRIGALRTLLEALK